MKRAVVEHPPASRPVTHTGLGPGVAGSPTKSGADIVTEGPERHMFRKRSDVQEALVHLYLRLNGYLTTGFIVHARAAHGDKTQVDVLAVRNAWNREPERAIDPSPFLRPVPALTDVLICEVKGGSQPAHFNGTLLKDAAAVNSILRWAGLFESDEIVSSVASRLQPLMRAACPAGQASEGALEGSVRVRALPCSPEKTGDSRGRWLLTHAELFGYVTECLNPREPRGCAVRYDFLHWGPWLAPVVHYFKGREPGDTGDIELLYSHLAV